MMDSVDEGWVLLQVVNHEAEAHLISGLLRAQGIGCRMQSMRVPQYPVTVDGLGEIHLFVAEKEVAKARRALAAVTRPPGE